MEAGGGTSVECTYYPEGNVCAPLMLGSTGWVFGRTGMKGYCKQNWHVLQHFVPMLDSWFCPEFLFNSFFSGSSEAVWFPVHYREILQCDVVSCGSEVVKDGRGA